MKSAHEMYPEAGMSPEWWDEADGPFFAMAREYGPLLKSLGDIVFQVDDHDYSGDSRVLYHRVAVPDGDTQPLDQYGILIFGWGSCSGCDALQACESYEAVEQLRDALATQIVWGTRAATLALLRDAETWAGRFGGNGYETKQFLAHAIVLLDPTQDEKALLAAMYLAEED